MDTERALHEILKQYKRERGTRGKQTPQINKPKELNDIRKITSGFEIYLQAASALQR